MPLLVGRRGGVRPDRVVAGIEVLDDALDRPTLAAGVATFEDDEQAGPDLPGAELPAEVEAQLEQAALGDFDASLVLAARQPLREVELVESRRRAHRLRCYAGGQRGYAWDLSAADRGRSDVHAPALAAAR